MLAISFLLFPLIGPYAFAATPDWTQVVDSSPNVAWYSSIALDSQGYTHIAYCDLANKQIKYAAQSSMGWDLKVVDSIGNNTGYSSLALDSSGNPHIAYFDQSHGELKYASSSGLGWTIQIVDHLVLCNFCSLKLDQTGNPHIAYQDSQNYQLKYASWTGTQWSIQTVDSQGAVGFFSSLALDQSGNPRISYCAAQVGSSPSSSILKFASWNGSCWDMETVDANQGVGLYDSLMLDSNGHACISYYDGLNGCLKYSHQANNSWNVQVVDNQGNTGNVGLNTCLALDSQNNPHIAYGDLKNRDVKYAYFNGSCWLSQAACPGGEIASAPSLALSPQGYPRISYCGGQDRELKDAAVDATLFPTPVAITFLSLPTQMPQPNGIYVVESSAANSGECSAIAVDANDTPHIAYIDMYAPYGPSNIILRYASWTGKDWSLQTVQNGIYGAVPSVAMDSQGSPHVVYRNQSGTIDYSVGTTQSWNIVPVVSPSYLASFNSLVLDSNGNVKMSLAETANESLQYVTYTNQGWTTQTVDNTGTQVAYNSLALDSQGNPQIAYLEMQPIQELKYACWNGSAWVINVVDVGSKTGMIPSIGIDSTGKVYIVYFGLTVGTQNDFLKCATLTASGWNITTVDSGIGVGLGSSMALDSHGYPHISYYNAGDGELRYAWWNGTAWNIKIADSQLGSNLQYTSIKMDSKDNAHISYYDSVNKTLKYAYITNPNLLNSTQNSQLTPSSTPSPTATPSPTPSATTQSTNHTSSGQAVSSSTLLMPWYPSSNAQVFPAPSTTPQHPTQPAKTMKIADVNSLIEEVIAIPSVIMVTLFAVKRKYFENE